MIRTKADIEFHTDGNVYGPSYPAVNIKVYGDYRRVLLPLDEGTCDGVPAKTHPAFTHDWVDEHLTEREIDDWFWIACEHGWEQIKSDAEDIFGSSVKVYAAGRSDGWAIVTSLSPIKDWDAIDLNPWKRFASWARLTADDVPRSMLDLIYYNVFLPQHEELMKQIVGM